MLVAENLDYLINKHRMSMDDFGRTFGLKRGVVGQYVRKLSLPKIETLILICEHFNLTLDEIIRQDLSSNSYKLPSEKNMLVEEPNSYNTTNNKYVKLLEQSLLDKNKIIESYEFKINIQNKSDSQPKIMDKSLASK